MPNTRLSSGAPSAGTGKSNGGSGKKLSFLFISSDKYPPYRVDVSVLFGRELAGRGHRIDWLIQSSTPCNKSYETTWCDCRVWVGSTNTGTSRRARLDKYLRGFIHDFKMFGLLRSNRYDFLQVKDKFLSALVAVIASRIHKVRLVYWLSYPFPEADLYAVKEGVARYPMFYLARGAINRFILYRVILRYAQHVFVQSEQMKKDVTAMGIPQSKLTVVPMGIDLDMFPYEVGDFSEKPDTGSKLVVYLGTLIKDRKLDFLVRVFRIVVDQISDAKLYFIGGGEDKLDVELLKQEVNRLELTDSVVFTGFLPREKALEYLRTAGVCVSPFYPTPVLNSTSPTKLIEYMAMGKAVVANHHPEQRSVIEESSGGICVPYEEAAFAEAIVSILKSPEMARLMGSRGRRYVEKFRAYEIIAGQLEKEYFIICDVN